MGQLSAVGFNLTANGHQTMFREERMKYSGCYKTYDGMRHE